MRKITLLFLLMVNLNAFAQTSPYEALGQGLGSLIGILVESFSNSKEPIQQDVSPAPQNSQSNQELDSFWRIEASKAKKELCGDPDFANFFKKTPCDVADMQAKNFSDSSFIKPADAKNLALISYFYENIARLESTGFIANFKPADKGFALSKVRLKESEDFSALLVKLGEKKITWGQFNTKRVELHDAEVDGYVRILH